MLYVNNIYIIFCYITEINIEIEIYIYKRLIWMCGFSQLAN